VLQEVKRVTGGRSVLCALSGGVDSVVLLHLLKNSGAYVVAAHVEHGIRGQQSLADCAFAEALCEDWGIKLVTAHIDVPSEAKASGRGIEETARALRYDFLRAQKEALCLDLIATAHHLNDQAETLLMHMLRGASPAGLSGMRQEQNGLIRPLLPFSRERIESYAREHGLAWVQDETNADPSYTRNYLRHNVVPGLKRVNPQAVEALGRLADLSAAQNDYMAQQAEALLSERMINHALRDVRDVHQGLRSVALHTYLVRCGVKEPDYDDVQRICALFAMSSGKRATISKRLFERDAQGVRMVTESQEGIWPLRLGVNDTPLGRFTLRLTEIPDSLDLGKNAQVFDAQKAGKTLYVRTKQPGDRVQLLGSTGSRLVSDVLTDKKVPRSVRGTVPLIVSGDDIIWIAGIAPCRPCAVSAGSTQALVIIYEE